METHVGFTTTSYRIASLRPVLESLFAQTRAPDGLHLWLSREPYLHDAGIAADRLPTWLRDFEANGRIRVRWTENTGPYRKLLPLLQEYRNRTDVALVTADDDVSYHPNWLASLCKKAARFPEAVIAHRVRVMRLQSGNLAPYSQWSLAGSLFPLRSRFYFPTGSGGVLYRPHFFPDAVQDAKRFRELCPAQDDVWFRSFTLRDGRDVVRAERWIDASELLIDRGPALWEQNQQRGENDRAIARTMDVRPLLDRLLDHTAIRCCEMLYRWRATTPRVP